MTVTAIYENTDSKVFNVDDVQKHSFTNNGKFPTILISSDKLTYQERNWLDYCTKCVIGSVYDS